MVKHRHCYWKLLGQEQPPNFPNILTGEMSLYRPLCCSKGRKTNPRPVNRKHIGLEKTCKQQRNLSKFLIPTQLNSVLHSPPCGVLWTKRTPSQGHPFDCHLQNRSPESPRVLDKDCFNALRGNKQHLHWVGAIELGDSSVCWRPVFISASRARSFHHSPPLGFRKHHASSQPGKVHFALKYLLC